MNGWPDHFSTWWTALVRPERAADLVLERERRVRFTRFLAVTVAVLYAFYGVSMGLYRGLWSGLFSALKLPLLYLATLLVCFPAFYVLNCQHAQRLSARQCLRLLLIATSTNALALASFAPISLFFSLTTSRAGYAFIVLLQVVVFAAAALLSVVAIAVIFRATAASQGRRLRPALVITWAVLYAFVLSQMSWVLRPWIGTWTLDYAPFRPIGGSFIETLLDMLV
jgi:hypothetical protein